MIDVGNINKQESADSPVLTYISLKINKNLEN